MSDTIKITPSKLGTIPTVTFLNTARNQRVVWPCTSVTAAKEAIAHLKKLDHVAEIEAHDAVVKTMQDFK